MQWHPGMQSIPFVAPLSMQVVRPTMHATGAYFLYIVTFDLILLCAEMSWDNEFSTLEQSLGSITLQNFEQLEQPAKQNPQNSDELARMAALLLENVKDEQNPKFQKSQFMGLMRQLRDGDVIVEGDQIVENHGQSIAPQVDVKGKGRAVDFPSAHRPHTISHTGFKDFLFSERSAISETNLPEQQVQVHEDEVDAYFRRENVEYTRYWNDIDVSVASKAHTANPDAASWDRLQDDWDKFEATATGIKPVDSYQFQHNNPYVIGDSSTTHHHEMHGHQSIFEVRFRLEHSIIDLIQGIIQSVLELEAAVQRDMSNASAWLALGVKQQENERERKALQALQHAVELDPSHLPAWLALAVSLTNNNNRVGTYDAIHEWVSRNDKYKASIQQLRGQNPDDPKTDITDKYAYLSQCLIAMARSNTSGEVDADIQIALAILLNANEVCVFLFHYLALTVLQDYAKAQDCFRTALAVRPDVRTVLSSSVWPLSFHRTGFYTTELELLWRTVAKQGTRSNITIERLSSILVTLELGQSFSRFFFRY
jgi:peroxin-5